MGLGNRKWVTSVVLLFFCSSGSGCLCFKTGSGKNLTTHTVVIGFGLVSRPEPNLTDIDVYHSRLAGIAITAGTRESGVSAGIISDYETIIPPDACGLISVNGHTPSDITVSVDRCDARPLASPHEPSEIPSENHSPDETRSTK